MIQFRVETIIASTAKPPNAPDLDLRKLTRTFVNSVLVVCSNTRLWLADRTPRHARSVTRCSSVGKPWWSTWSTPIKIRTLPGLPVSI